MMAERHLMALSIRELERRSVRFYPRPIDRVNATLYCPGVPSRRWRGWSARHRVQWGNDWLMTDVRYLYSTDRGALLPGGSWIMRVIARTPGGNWVTVCATAYNKRKDAKESARNRWKRQQPWGYDPGSPFNR